MGKSDLRFSEISTPDSLKRYLKHGSRLNSSRYLYHYTSLNSALLIIKNKRWHLSTASQMNDLLEYNNGDPRRWKNIFFTSFMMESKESIGMWSMYAQPWENGVKIAIPKEELRKWTDFISTVYEVDIQTYQETGRKTDLFRDQAFLSAIAYNTTSEEMDTVHSDLLRCGGQTNRLFTNSSTISELTGYIKDDAWSYEKELRLCVDFDNTPDFSRIAVEIPDSVIDSMIITSSPLFEGDLMRRIQIEIESFNFSCDKSLFTGRLSKKTICDNCTYKRSASSL